MTNQPTNILSFLGDHIRACMTMGCPVPLERLVFSKGKVYPKIANHRFPDMELKECYRNAAALAMEIPDVTYVEGFAYRPGLPMLMGHAWVVNNIDGVIDVTWRDSKECKYVGIPFTQDELRDHLLETGVYGILDTGRGPNWKLIKKLDPDLWTSLVQEIPALENAA